MSNIQKTNHNKEYNRQVAYNQLMQSLNEQVMVKNILTRKHNEMVESYKKANKQRKEKMQVQMKQSIDTIYATNNRIKKLLKEKQVLESRGCR